VPQNGEVVSGKVVELPPSGGIAYIELDEPSPPYAIAALVRLQQVTEKARETFNDRRRLALGDRLVGLVVAVRPDELLVEVDCWAHLEHSRRDSERQNLTEGFRTRGEGVALAAPTSTEQGNAHRRFSLDGKRIVIFDDDTDLADITCAWFRHNGAEAEGVHKIQALRA
jgi:hypothetical protein